MLMAYAISSNTCYLYYTLRRVVERIPIPHTVVIRQTIGRLTYSLRQAHIPAVGCSKPPHSVGTLDLAWRRTK
jgi:hypothetical protein